MGINKDLYIELLEKEVLLTREKETFRRQGGRAALLNVERKDLEEDNIAFQALKNMESKEVGVDNV